MSHPLSIHWEDHCVRNVLYSGEVTPFFFNDVMFLLENIPAPASGIKAPAWQSRDSHVQIRRCGDGTVVSHPLVNCGFASASVQNGEVWIFAVAQGAPFGEAGKTIVSTHSCDLYTWTKPQTAITANGGERLYNTGLVADGGRFVLLYETDDPAFVPYTFKFAESDDLRHWVPIPDAIFGADHYCGGPWLYRTGGYFYLTYVNRVPKELSHFPNCRITSDYACYYDTRIARSRDLKSWEYSDHPVLTPDFEHEIAPEQYPGFHERNASDAEFVEHDDRISVFWNGGNQLGIYDLQSAWRAGSLADFFELFFPVQ